MNKLFGINTTDLEFGTRSDLFEGSIHAEDGTPMMNSYHQVTATAPNGVRFAKAVGISSWDTHYDEDGCISMFRNEDPTDLNHRADTLANKLNNIFSPRLNEDMWYEIDPEYGSATFQEKEAFESINPDYYAGGNYG